MTSTITPSTTVGVRAVAGVIGTLVAVSVPPFLVGTLAIQMGRTMAFGAADVATAVAGYYAVSALLSRSRGASSRGAAPRSRCASPRSAVPPAWPASRWRTARPGWSSR